MYCKKKGFWLAQKWVWLCSSSRHSIKRQARIILKLLLGVFNFKETHTRRVALIFFSLEVSRVLKFELKS